MGVAGSGKTTVGSLLARELNLDFYDADDFHSESNRKKMSEGIPLTDEDRATWLLSLKNMLYQNSQTDKSVVLACSALKESYRETLKIKNNVKFVYLRGTYQQIEDRLNNRAGHYMSAKMLASQFEILEEPKNTLIIDITNSPEEIVMLIRKGLNL
jgi:carbohydrate kinase (thermoresistant glucokinase family)